MSNRAFIGKPTDLGVAVSTGEFVGVVLEVLGAL